MKKSYVIAAMIAATLSMGNVAFATTPAVNQNHTCQGAFNCNDTTNNNNSVTNHGGAGGQGGIGLGFGGTATAKGGSATVGDMNNSSNSNATIQNGAVVNHVKTGASTATVGDVTNNNTAKGGNATQGQMQGQIGVNKMTDSGNSSATGINGDIIIGMSAAEAEELARSTQPDLSDNSVNMNTTTNYEAPKIPVTTAYAPSLVAAEDACMGSTSVGGQGITFGLSFGTTWRDDNCVIRKDARFLHAAGYPDVSLSLMCSKGSVLEAVKRAGTPAQKAACGLTE